MLARCDLHLHSSASRDSQEWLPRRFGCPESYAEPAAQYELCKARGMTFVTLTDHDTIEGGLQLVDRPDFFLSEEITARVPPAPGAEGCVVHVLAWNITPADHDRIQAVRSDVFALVDYLRGRGIAHALAHPFESPNRQLDAPTLERLMLLFSTFEVVNGRTDERLNAGARALVEATDARALRRLSSQHGLPPARGVNRPAAFVAGSDDHEHPRAATCYTEVDGARDVPELFEAVMAGRARAVGRGADVVRLGAVFGATAHRFLGGLAQEGGPASPFTDVMDALGGNLAPERAKSAGHREFLDRLARVARDVLPADRPLDVAAVTTASDALALGDAQIRVCDALVRDAVDAATGAAIDCDFFGLFGALRDAAGGIKAMLPFLFAAHHMGRQVQDMERLGREWTASPWPAPAERLAVFADTLSQVDGVSMWCKRFVEDAARAGREVHVPHCGAVSEAIRTPDLERFFVELPEVAGVAIPPSIYQDLRLALPSFVRVLAWMQETGISHVEIATPGPLGLAGLLAAKVLRLPVRATYHTEVPALVRMLTGSERLERWAAAYVGWFYRQVDRATVFSDGAQERLVGLGVPRERVERRDLAVDPDDFSPRHAEAADGAADAVDDLDLPAGRPVVLTVGRLSREKNVPLMLEAMARLDAVEPRPLLVVVGDGPERARLEGLAAGRDDVRLVGPRGGATLRRLYARAEAFVFASEIDTLGLAAMEAMSSGAPVLIPRGANLSAMVEHRRSAYLYAPAPDALAAALREVLTDRELAALLGREGRARMVAQWNRARDGAVAAAQPRGAVAAGQVSSAC
jgi:glycosyltransferase involved in cell wall biosynthesis